VGELRYGLTPDPDPDDVDAHLRPAVVLSGQPQPGEPAQFLRRDRLLDPT
jgi:hypothetical protein